jgi:polyisoprenoid-binding protein YceI
MIDYQMKEAAMSEISTATPITRTVDGVELPVPGTYTLDTSHSSVNFVVKHLMVSKTRGTFTGFTGTVVIGEDPADSSVEVTVDVASVHTRDEKRDGHLRSADFFHVEEHPTMTYKSTSVKPAGNEWLVDGDLTVHGVTGPLQLRVAFEGAASTPWGGQALGFSATGEVNREDFGLTWNQALETGGVLVGKKATIEIEAEAVPAT